MDNLRHIELKTEHSIEHLIEEMFVGYYNDYELLDKMEIEDVIKYLKETRDLL
jgi:hypothetical protein